MAFEPVNASHRQGVRQDTGVPTVTFYGRSAQFRLNASALAAMEEKNQGRAFDRVRVAYDAENQRLGFTPTTHDDGSAVKLNSDKADSPSRYFGFRVLAVKAGLDLRSRFTLPLVYDDATGMFVINLADREPTPIATRRSRTSADSGAAAEPSPAAAA